MVGRVGGTPWMVWWKGEPDRAMVDIEGRPDDIAPWGGGENVMLETGGGDRGVRWSLPPAPEGLEKDWCWRGSSSGRGESEVWQEDSVVGARLRSFFLWGEEEEEGEESWRGV